MANFWAYTGKKSLSDLLTFLGVIALIVALFTFQIQTYTELSSLFYLTGFIITFFFVSELLSTESGIFTAAIIFSFELLYGSQSPPEYTDRFYNLAFLFALVVAFYYLIKQLRARRLEKASAQAEHFHSLANYSLQPLILKNKKGEVLFASNSIKDLLDLKKNLPFGKSLDDLIHPDDLREHEKFMEEVIYNPLKRKSIELRLKKGDGWIWARDDTINLLDQKDIKAIVSSFQDITDQKTVFDKEKAARNLAENAVRQRDEFLSIASHELKTPLTSVLLQLQTTLRKISTQSLSDFSGTELLRALQIAEKQSQNLTTLINDLLNVSVASTGRLNLRKEKIDLVRTVESTLEKYSEEIRLSGCVVKTLVKDKNITGVWDPVRVDQAISNLLINALRYSANKPISIIVGKEKDFAVVKVRDHGKGIPEKYLDIIFEPFKRANQDGSIEGLGVGLFISKQIARTHKGDITVESTEGKGSTFTLKLPLSKK